MRYFEKQGNMATREGAEILHTKFIKHLVKSHIKHQGKEGLAVRFKNDFVDAGRAVTGFPNAKNQAKFKKAIKGFPAHVKKMLKDL